MLLTIDAGNSFVKWGYHDGRAWLSHERANLTAFCTDPLQYLERYPTRVVVSNVAGIIFQDALMRALPNIDLCWAKAEAQACGVSNHYDKPAQLGSDRWAALIAARAITSAPCLVVSIGTALTVDMLAENGAFLGGLIAPGPQLMREALAHGTDAIQPPDGNFVPFPSNTADAVQTGVIYALLGTIEQAAAAFEAKQGAGAACILTGGAANLITPYLNRPYQLVDNLVLEGLLVMAKEEKPS
ncbi:MAG: type III pantothenate kinase [Hydrogenophilales bacterium]|nr:type III pantothenate kinase [Hydrogenophilales bacterium]